MNLIVSQRICEKEFGTTPIPENDLRIVLDKFSKGLYDIIKGYSLPKGFRLGKTSTTIKGGGARRILFLIRVETGEGFLLLYRDKKDKAGENMTVRNPHFLSAIARNQDLLLRDLKEGKVREYSAKTKKP